MSGWMRTKIEELFNVGSSKRVLKTDWKTSGIPFYRGREITSLCRYGAVDNELYITPEHYDDLKEKYGVPAAGDIMITAIGTIGNTHIVRSADKFYFKDASVLWLSKRAEVDSRFINYWLKSESFLSQLDANNGATVDTLTIKKLQSVEIDLPPLPVQKAIVAKLDAAFASIEQAIAAAEQNAENAKQLVEHYIDVNFQILAATHPGGKLGDMCEGVEYGSAAKSDKTGDIPVLRMGNIIDGEIDYDDLVYTSDKTEFEKYRLRKGDVLFNRTNSPLHVGKSAVFEDERDAIFAGYLIRVKNKRELLNSNYLNYYLNSKSIRNYGYSVMSHSVNQANINGSKLKEYPISVPAMQTQIDIVRKFGKLKSECVKLEYAYRIKITKFSALKQSLLQQAFNGQLVDA